MKKNLDWFFFVLATPQGMQDLGSLTNDQTRALCSESVEPFC